MDFVSNRSQRRDQEGRPAADFEDLLVSATQQRQAKVTARAEDSAEEGLVIEAKRVRIGDGSQGPLRREPEGRHQRAPLNFRCASNVMRASWKPFWKRLIFVSP